MGLCKNVVYWVYWYTVYPWIATLIGKITIHPQVWGFPVNKSSKPLSLLQEIRTTDFSRGHDLEEALLALQVVLQGSLGVVDGGVP